MTTTRQDKPGGKPRQRNRKGEQRKQKGEQRNSPARNPQGQDQVRPMIATTDDAAAETAAPVVETPVAAAEVVETAAALEMVEAAAPAEVVETEAPAALVETCGIRQPADDRECLCRICQNLDAGEQVPGRETHGGAVARQGDRTSERIRKRGLYELRRGIAEDLRSLRPMGPPDPQALGSRRRQTDPGCAPTLVATSRERGPGWSGALVLPPRRVSPLARQKQAGGKHVNPGRVPRSAAGHG
jgi:hypothetical protein